MKGAVIRKNVGRYVAVTFTALLMMAGCNKLEVNNDPIPVWEDWDADSATLNVSIQTQGGVFLVGQFVNLALSQDSLNAGHLVRRVSTDGNGRVVFYRLFPGKYYMNCFSTYLGETQYGSGNISLGPYEVRDTLLIVH
jgi:hypothetical protein